MNSINVLFVFRKQYRENPVLVAALSDDLLA